jgi:hypothetical protein
MVWELNIKCRVFKFELCNTMHSWQYQGRFILSTETNINSSEETNLTVSKHSAHGKESATLIKVLEPAKYKA